MPIPDLHVFAISHYCEKARFALDWLGIEHALHYTAPGPHIQVMQSLGLENTATPVLVAGDEVVQGSGAILDWAESARPDPTRSLAPDPDQAGECRALEQRLDDVAGIHTRRYYYAEALVEHPETVLPIFTRYLEPEARAPFEAIWSTVREVMTERLDLGLEQWNESREIVEGELDWLDGLLADGHRFLLGDRFTRADLTAASLLSPAALPPEHPTYGELEIPPRARADLARWSERPAVAWVREIYRTQR